MEIKRFFLPMIFMFYGCLQCAAVGPSLMPRQMLSFDEFNTLLSILAKINIMLLGVVNVHMYDFSLLTYYDKKSVYLGDYVTDSTACGVHKKMICVYPQESELVEKMLSIGKIDNLKTEEFFALFCGSLENFCASISPYSIKYVDVTGDNLVLKKYLTLTDMVNEYVTSLSFLTSIYRLNPSDFLDKFERLNQEDQGKGLCNGISRENISKILKVKLEDLECLPRWRRFVNGCPEGCVAAVSCLLRALPMFVANLIWVVANNSELKNRLVALFTSSEIEIMQSSAEGKFDIINYLYALTPPMGCSKAWLYNQYNETCSLQ